MAINVYPGYRGYADFGTQGGIIRFADAKITAKQSVVAPDLIMGDWDHDAYRYGPIEVGGSINGPITETFVSGGAADSMLGVAMKRVPDCGLLTTIDQLALYYYCGGTENRTRTFSNMLVQSLSLSCAAGDVATFSMEVLGTAAGAWGTSDPDLHTIAEKLLTWDKVAIQVTSSSDGGSFPVDVAFQNFEFTVNNNIETVYSLGQPNLFPAALVPGLRTITGSLSVFNIPEQDGYDTWDDYVAANVGTIQFSLGATVTIKANVRWHRVEPASSVGPIVSTLAFTGVTHQTDPFWTA